MPSTTTRGFPFPIAGDKIRNVVATIKALADKIEADVGLHDEGQIGSGVLVANTPKAVAVVFNTPFPGIPKVTAQGVSVVPHQRLVSTANVTAAGFNLYFVNTANATAFAADWHASY